MSSHPPEPRKKPPVPLRWFRNVFEPMPPLPPVEQPRPMPLTPPLPPAPLDRALSSKGNNGKKNEPAAPLPIANPLLRSSGENPPPTSPDEVTEAIRGVNTAVVALSELESTSSHPAKDLIGKVARHSLRDVGRLLQGFQRSKRR